MKSTYNGYTFQLNENVTRTQVRFHNRYGIELAGDLYLPKNTTGKLAAIAVSGPFGAVKEQASGLYADELASRGFAAMAFDPSFIGESGGDVRNVASPDINTEGIFRPQLISFPHRILPTLIKSAFSASAALAAWH